MSRNVRSPSFNIDRDIPRDAVPDDVAALREPLAIERARHAISLLNLRIRAGRS